MDRSTSIALLNHAIADELYAVNQYMFFHFHLDDQGLAPLSNLFKRTAIAEMMHVERLAERVLFLKGVVEMAASAPVEQITDPKAMLKKAMAMEEGSQNDYNKAAIACGANADAVTKQLFEALTADEEAHYSLYEKQFDNIERFGLSYLVLNSFGSAAEVGAGHPTA
ncbi:MAG: bacterioferritin [Holophaga sp.]|nr:bacterioferritin [Holophaga sp.]